MTLLLPLILQDEIDTELALSDALYRFHRARPWRWIPEGLGLAVLCRWVPGFVRGALVARGVRRHMIRPERFREVRRLSRMAAADLRMRTAKAERQWVADHTVDFADAYRAWRGGLPWRLVPQRARPRLFGRFGQRFARRFVYEREKAERARQQTLNREKDHV